MFKKHDKLLSIKELRHAAIGLLARREYSAHELTEKYISRAENPDDWPDVLQRLQDDGLQSDERFCESFLRSRLYKPYGPVRIKQELRLKGIDNLIMQQCFDEQSPDWRALAIEARQRRFGEALPDEPKERARQQRFLQSRGFSLDDVYGAFSGD